MFKSDNFSDKWGGYMFILSIDLIVFTMTYPGYYTDAVNNIQPIMNYMKTAQLSCGIQQYNTYYDYAIVYGGNTTRAQRRYYFNDLVPKNNLTNGYVNELLEYVNDSKSFKQTVPSFSTGLTFILIHGNVQQFPDDYTSVNPSWRKSMFVVDSGAAWNDSKYDEQIVEFTSEHEGIFQQYGIGIYTNEENMNCDGCDWKQQFWSLGHYDRLLKIKQKWDPNQVFWCNHCVGSDQN